MDQPYRGLVDFLRPELKFDGLDALITQMDAIVRKRVKSFNRYEY